jgi:N-acetylglucosaminyldiphosphoundecaprenol N-acetyl-beta-D-mannosaminyltransferase
LVLADRSDTVKIHKVMGLPVHWRPDYAGWLLEQYRQGQGAHVVTLNAEMAMQADQDPALRQIILAADLVIPDGAGVVLYFRTQGWRIRRTPGIELAAHVLQQLSPHETAFFYGGAPGITDHAALYWRRQRGDISIVGTQHGFLTPEDQLTFLQRLADLQPSVILVGLGVPRQELWIRDHRHLCPQSLWIGVGGSFDIWAGVKSRAPDWMGNNHLEWLYRLYQEPWRWRRMLALPQFAWRSLTYSSR